MATKTQNGVHRKHNVAQPTETKSPGTQQSLWVTRQLRIWAILNGIWLANTNGVFGKRMFFLIL